MIDGKGVVLILPALGRLTGLGHVIRCRSVARELAERGWRVDWLLPSAEAGLAAGLDLPGSIDAFPAGTDAELLAARRAIQRAGGVPVVLLVDSYQIDSAGLLALRGPGVRLVLFEDGVVGGELPVDLLINPSPAASPAQYLGRTTGRCLCGAAYAAIDAAFFATRPRRDSEERLLISFGGSDPLDLTRAFVSLLEQRPTLPGIPIDIVTGAAYPHASEVRARVERLGLDIRYHHNVRDMAAIMRRARLALVAAGSTLFELAVSGVPAIPCVVADNQWPTASWLAAFSAAPLVDLRVRRSGGEFCILLPEGLLETVRRLWADPVRLQQIRERLSSCCDGRGAWRIADAIEELTGGSPMPSGEQRGTDRRQSSLPEGELP